MTTQARTLLAEALGTALLVFFACGVATLTFGFTLTGTSVSAGIVATSLAFGLVLLALAYSLGPVSGCHVNPAVTMGFFVSKRFTLQEAVRYWVAQFVGGIAGAALLWAMFSGIEGYDVKVQGLGADGFANLSMTNLNGGGAFLAEVVLTFLFVYVVLAVTGRMGTSASVAGVAIGIALVAVHLIGIPLTGTSVNPARSLGPALFVGDDALEQVWLFIVAPLAGGALAAVVHEVLAPPEG
ncbi:MAG: MIP family channel protein [Acidimicrobiales bacterium]